MTNQYDASVTSSRIKARAKEMGMAISQLNSICDLSENTIKNAGKSTEGMKARNLYLIAETLDCSVDYLLGRTDEPQAKAGCIKENHDNNVFGVNAVDFTVPITTYPASSEQQQEIDRMMSDLSPRERNKLMGIILLASTKSIFFKNP